RRCRPDPGQWGSRGRGRVPAARRCTARAGAGADGGHRAQPHGYHRTREPMVVGPATERSVEPARELLDVDWASPISAMKGKVLLGVLGDRYGRELENGA